MTAQTQRLGREAWETGTRDWEEGTAERAANSRQGYGDARRLPSETEPVPRGGGERTGIKCVGANLDRVFVQYFPSF